MKQTSKNQKKLGSYLDEIAEINKRKQLASFALLKYRKIWKNCYISIKNKTIIYNIYVRSILLYNCSTWVVNKTFNDKIDSFHRKQLRICLDIHYPKIIKNEELYQITNQNKLSEINATRRRSHLGHILRRNTPTRDILQNITQERPRGKKRNPANIIKTHFKDLGLPDFNNWVIRAMTRRL